MEKFTEITKNPAIFKNRYTSVYTCQISAWTHVSLCSSPGSLEGVLDFCSQIAIMLTNWQYHPFLSTHSKGIGEHSWSINSESSVAE